MATYKVIQDIEAEDKLLGPLSLRQFIYASIVAVSAFIGYKLFFLNPWLPMALLPHMILFAILAAPLGQDQPSEIWLLAKIRFFLKPRRRIWDQSGVKQLVTITAPKTIERQLTDNLTQSEVKSRLRALADTIDSRGWAVKNVDLNTYSTPGYANQSGGSDRLLNAQSLPQEVPSFDVQGINDMLDEKNNATAQHLSQMIDQSTQAHRQQVVDMMRNGGIATAPSNPLPSQTTQPAGQQNVTPDYWFLNGTNGQAPQVQPGFSTFDHNPVVAPGVSGGVSSSRVDTTTQDEAAFLDHVHAEQNRFNTATNNSHLRTIQPLSKTPEGTYTAPAQQPVSAHPTEGYSPDSPLPYPDLIAPVSATPSQPTQTTSSDDASPYAPPPPFTADIQNSANPSVTGGQDPAILDLANNDDLSVATLARQANKTRQVDMSTNDEVVISLH